MKQVHIDISTFLVACSLSFILAFLPEKAWSSFSLDVYEKVNFLQGNNAYLWETVPTDQTQIVENIFLPTLKFKWSFLTLKGGVGVASPLQGSQLTFYYLPYAQIGLNFNQIRLILGNLETTHHYPAPLWDPITSFSSRTRIINRKYVSINHSFFEQGIQIQDFYQNYSGEAYFNFQSHRLKDDYLVFDFGLSQSAFISELPFYGALRGFLSSSLKTNTVENTFNLTAAFGLRNDFFNTLILFSYYHFEDQNPLITSTWGEGIYLDYYYYSGDWIIQPQFWVSSSFLLKQHHFIALEGDPFFRAPLYIGLNIYKIFTLTKSSQIKIVLLNGGYIPNADSDLYWKMLRYDQIVKFEWEYHLPL